MKARIGKAVAALLMFLFFAVACAGVIVLMPALIGHWLWRGLDSDEDYIYRVGKAMDQVTNAALFAGHPKETVSSHVGRLILREREGGVRAPRWAHMIDWVTDKVDKNHCVDAIEEPFIGMPL